MPQIQPQPTSSNRFNAIVSESSMATSRQTARLIQDDLARAYGASRSPCNRPYCCSGTAAWFERPLAGA